MDYGRAIIVDDLASVELGPSRPVIYDREIDLRLPYEDPASGAEHDLIRYPAGLTTPAHRHTAAHTIVILEGWLEVNDKVIGPGAYCHFPAGEAMRHAPARGRCLLVRHHVRRAGGRAAPRRMTTSDAPWRARRREGPWCDPPSPRGAHGEEYPLPEPHQPSQVWSKRPGGTGAMSRDIVTRCLGTWCHFTLRPDVGSPGSDRG